jgi:hypothetical protein
MDGKGIGIGNETGKRIIMVSDQIKIVSVPTFHVEFLLLEPQHIAMQDSAKLTFKGRYPRTLRISNFL